MSGSEFDLSKLQTLVITVSLSPESIDKFRALFKTVHYHPDGQVPGEVQSEAEVWFTNWAGFPDSVARLEDVPNVRILQLSSGQSAPYSHPQLDLYQDGSVSQKGRDR